jgi:hypothetical protein
MSEGQEEATMNSIPTDSYETDVRVLLDSSITALLAAWRGYAAATDTALEAQDAPLAQRLAEIGGRLGQAIDLVFILQHEIEEVPSWRSEM